MHANPTKRKNTHTNRQHRPRGPPAGGEPAAAGRLEGVTRAARCGLHVISTWGGINRIPSVTEPIDSPTTQRIIQPNPSTNQSADSIKSTNRCPWPLSRASPSPPSSSSTSATAPTKVRLALICTPLGGVEIACTLVAAVDRSIRTETTAASWLTYIPDSCFAFLSRAQASGPSPSRAASKYARGDGGNGVGAGDGNVHVKQSKEAKDEPSERKTERTR